MKKHHFILKDRETGEIYYTPSEIEVYGGLLSLTKKPDDIIKIFRNAFEGYEIIGEKFMSN